MTHISSMSSFPLSYHTARESSVVRQKTLGSSLRGNDGSFVMVVTHFRNPQ